MLSHITVHLGEQKMSIWEKAVGSFPYPENSLSKNIHQTSKLLNFWMASPRLQLMNLSNSLCFVWGSIGRAAITNIFKCQNWTKRSFGKHINYFGLFFNKTNIFQVLWLLLARLTEKESLNLWPRTTWPLSRRPSLSLTRIKMAQSPPRQPIINIIITFW